MSIPRWIHRHVPNLVPIRPAVWQLPHTFECVTPNPPDMPPVVLRGDLYLAYAHSQMNPQTWTKVGANRSSRLTASPDFWMFDPLTPPPPPKCPLVSLRAICLAYIHSQMNLHMCTKFDANRTSRLTSSPDFWICDPLTPPHVEGRIVFSRCPFPDESAEVCQIWCQSVQLFDSLPILLDLGPPEPPPPPEMPPFVLRFNWFGIYPFPDEYAHVCQIWCQSVQRFGSFSWICAKLVRLLATGRAVSRKNTPKNNIYTSIIIIPARTCRHQRH